MISNTNIESNCKRIAKHIMRHSAVVVVSQSLCDDFLANKSAYINGVNKHLKGIRVADGHIYTTGYWHIEFNLTHNAF